MKNTRDKEIRYLGPDGVILTVKLELDFYNEVLDYYVDEVLEPLATKIDQLINTESLYMDQELKNNYLILDKKDIFIRKGG